MTFFFLKLGEGHDEEVTSYSGRTALKLCEDFQRFHRNTKRFAESLLHMHKHKSYKSRRVQFFILPFISKSKKTNKKTLEATGVFAQPASNCGFSPRHLVVIHPALSRRILTVPLHRRVCEQTSLMLCSHQIVHNLKQRGPLEEAKRNSKSAELKEKKIGPFMLFLFNVLVIVIFRMITTVISTFLNTSFLHRHHHYRHPQLFGHNAQNYFYNSSISPGDQ